MSLSFWGGFELRVVGDRVALPLNSQRVVAFLGLIRGLPARVFVAGNLWIDASDERAAAALRTAPWRLGKAGEPLPEWHDDWVLIARERLRQLRLHGLEELCRGCSADGRHAEATEPSLAAVGREPLRESAHRVLIAAHLAYVDAIGPNLAGSRAIWPL